MAEEYCRHVLRVVIAQICQTIGWHSITTTPLEVLKDVLQSFITDIADSAHRYGEQCGHTSPTVADIALAFNDWGVNISELEEYVEYVAPVPCAISVPKFPVERDSHLNLLKPGSREVVTRPVHIHEHLPAMHPQLEEEYLVKQSPLSVDITGTEPGSGTSPLSSPKNSLFKRPGDPISAENNLLKRARMMLEEEGRPLREISSVMMTTSGFLSPAREGKLPEARTPTQSSDSRSSSPQPLSYPTVPPEVKGEKKTKKYSNKSAMEGIRKIVDKEVSKAKDMSSDIQVTEDDDPNVKKLVSMKEVYKLKALKPGAIKMLSPNNGASGGGSGSKSKSNKLRNAPGISPIIAAMPKIPKLSQSKNSKSEKPLVGAQSTKTANTDKSKEVGVIEGKLSSEPDKQKLNIFKKISKVKEEKTDQVDLIKNSHESLVTANAEQESKQRDMRWAQISETIEAVIQKSREQPSPPPEQHEIVDIESSESELFSYDDDLSPPGTPSTPRTPDLIPPQKKSDKHLDSKKKKRGKRDRDKKESKDRFTHSPSPKRFKSESTESDYSFLEKPKTPEVESTRDEPVLLPRNREDIMSSHGFPFIPFPPAPGLIPPHIANPLFNRLNMSMTKQPGGLMVLNPTMPNIQLPPPLHVNKHEEITTSKSKKQQPSPSSTLTTTQIAQSSRISPSSLISSTNRVSPSSHTSPNSRVSPITVSSSVSAPDTTDAHSSTVSVVPTKEKSAEKKKEHKKEKKEKIKKKKDKKEKLKNKEKGEKKKIKSGKKIKDKDKNKEKKEKKEKKKDKEREEKEKPETSVPKLTLKLGPSSPQGGGCSSNITSDTPHRKIVIKPVIEPPRVEPIKEEKRSPSPELARISALVTRPTNSKPPPTVPLAQSVDPLAESSFSSSLAMKKPTNHSANQAGQPKLKSKEVPKKANQVEPEKKDPVAFYFDKEGNQVWICPACNGQDDGSPMIGCDGCDAWYHWVCVGIQVPPDSNDWFCRVCISKRQDSLGDRKKKTDRRKKKGGGVT
ncbi:transcription initiation factor TFIID subunit 3-like isoform X2 [Homalodisca vitripennis]|uniref:transcription initiation factor TFIID subunit 3-like isoform X2 n=1 Tax=Homalodisca vitripennis TaxID=197043 RepID=UPI001EE9DC77|nr:transcription initiation factor TFIID subunit 3-like isoform X2 [Homalodisca vitripennis]